MTADHLHTTIVYYRDELGDEHSMRVIADHHGIASHPDFPRLTESFYKALGCEVLAVHRVEEHTVEALPRLTARQRPALSGLLFGLRPVWALALLALFMGLDLYAAVMTHWELQAITAERQATNAEILSRLDAIEKALEKEGIRLGSQMK